MMMVATNAGTSVIAAAELLNQLLLDFFAGDVSVSMCRLPEQERRRREDHPVPRLAELGDRRERLIVYALGPCAADHVGHRVTSPARTRHRSSFCAAPPPRR